MGAATAGGGNAGTIGTSAGGGTAAGDGGGAGLRINPGAGGEMTGAAGAAEVDDLSACAKWSEKSEALPSVLELVIDTSASMGWKPADGSSSKWVLARQALGKAFTGLPADTALGILFYPGVQSTGSPTPVDVSSCVDVDKMLPIALLGEKDSEQRVALQNALNAVMPVGDTPTHDAYDYALTSGLEMTRIEGTRFMLLVTDGAPTFTLGCVGDTNASMPAPTQPIVDEIQAANQQGIRTFVVGAPGTEVSTNGEDARRWLSEAARAGGTALDGCSDDGPNYCHIDLSQSTDFKSALSDGLARVAGQVIPCSFSIPPAPAGQVIDTADINAFYSTPDDATPALIERNQSPSCTEGWRLDGGQVTLCPSTCEKVRETAGTTVKLLFGCASVVAR
jgi:hypothetical protein